MGGHRHPAVATLHAGGMFLVGEEVPERGDGALLAAAGGAILVSHQQPGGLVGGAIGRHVGGDEERFTGPASVVVVVVVVVVAVAGLCTFKLFSELGTSYITGEPHRSQLAQALFSLNESFCCLGTWPFGLCYAALRG
jgi:hypothetical protein